jgi:predicted phage tail protein
MATVQESAARTRAFARVLGPYLVIVPGIIAVRLPEATALARPFFANSALVFIMGALMVFGGVFIVANHQFWRGISATFISVFGWILGLRGLVLLLAPQAYERRTYASAGAVGVIRLLFGLIVLAGLKLTYDGWIARPPTDR